VTSRARQLLYARTHSRTGAGRGHHPNEITRIAPLSADAEPLALVWADLLGRARVNARIAARHLVFIVVAGAIAAFGVISQNQILIVGRVQPARAEHRIPDTRELADHPGRPGRRNRRDEALETRASAAVRVAISVTTISAAAFLGVAAGIGEVSKSLDALGVLSANVAMMIVGGSSALAVQRAMAVRVDDTSPGEAR
jgi:hypothetical protein